MCCILECKCQIAKGTCFVQNVEFYPNKVKVEGCAHPTPAKANTTYTYRRLHGTMTGTLFRPDHFIITSHWLTLQNWTFHDPQSEITDLSCSRYRVKAGNHCLLIPTIGAN